MRPGGIGAWSARAMRAPTGSRRLARQNTRQTDKIKKTVVLKLCPNTTSRTNPLFHVAKQLCHVNRRMLNTNAHELSPYIEPACVLQANIQQPTNILHKNCQPFIHRLQVVACKKDGSSHANFVCALTCRLLTVCGERAGAHETTHSGVAEMVSQGG